MQGCFRPISCGSAKLHFAFCFCVDVYRCVLIASEQAAVETVGRDSVSQLEVGDLS